MELQNTEYNSNFNEKRNKEKMSFQYPSIFCSVQVCVDYLNKVRRTRKHIISVFMIDRQRTRNPLLYIQFILQTFPHNVLKGNRPFVYQTLKQTFFVLRLLTKNSTSSFYLQVCLLTNIVFFFFHTILNIFFNIFFLFIVSSQT